MYMWIIIFWTALVVTGISLAYLSVQISHLPILQKIFSNKKTLLLIGPFIIFVFFGLTGVVINFVNAIVIIIYIAFMWLLIHIFYKIIQRFFHKILPYKNLVSILFCLGILSIGWYLAHHVWPENYFLTTSKKILDLKIVMFADSHLGTTFDSKGFQKHLDAMQTQNPDLVVVVGDFVDDETSKEEMIQACQSLGKMKTKYGVYFVLGNHDKGYYGARDFSLQDLISELRKNGISVLQDDIVLVDNSFYLIGRKDLSEAMEKGRKRQSMEELIKDLDKKKYMIVLDHQPADYQNQEKSEVDLVLSGHTHGGQLFPFNYVGKWIGVNNQTYGHEKRNKTDFIVTSGISCWAIQFKTGTKSEYVVIDIKKKLK